MKVRLVGITVAAIVAGMPATLFAADWWYLGKAVDGEVALADANSIVVDGNYRHVWLWQFPKTPKKGVVETKTRLTINCEKQTILVSDSTDFGLDGSVIGSSHAESYESATAIIPESMGETYRDFACNEPAKWEGLQFFGPLNDPGRAFRYHPPTAAKRAIHGKPPAKRRSR